MRQEVWDFLCAKPVWDRYDEMREPWRFLICLAIVFIGFYVLPLPIGITILFILTIQKEVRRTDR